MGVKRPVVTAYGLAGRQLRTTWKHSDVGAPRGENHWRGRRRVAVTSSQGPPFPVPLRLAVCVAFMNDVGLNIRAQVFRWDSYCCSPLFTGEETGSKGLDGFCSVT